MLGNDIHQSALDVLGHPLGIAANIDVGTFSEPGPQLPADFAHAILHVKLLGAIARPRQRKARQQARGLHRVQLIRVEEVEIATLVAKEQPIAPRRAGGPAVEKECPERSNSGPRPDHDDGNLRIFRQRKAMGPLHIGGHLLAGFDALGQKGRSQAKPLAFANHVADAINGERQLPRGGVVRRGNRVEPWLQRFQRLDEGLRMRPDAFVEALEPLQPRLYSISSSHNATPGKLSLTVDCVRYVIGKRKRLGLASTFLAERVKPGEKVAAYVQRAHGFALPKDPKVPIIMIGPGTGIAPFRAFLLDRRATGATGRNWLFFGHQRSDFDFFYSDELNAMKTAGLLTRLSLAWSRDGAKKFYVQDRMREVGRELWAWLAEGAHVYVCGDAKRMAKDVERALVDIVAQHGARSTDEAISFVGELKKKGKYQQDVY